MKKSILNPVKLLLEPHPRILDEDQRRNARIFSALMLFHLGLVAMMLPVLNMVIMAQTGVTIYEDLDFWAVVAGLVVIAVAYALLRSGHYKPGLILYIATTAVVSVLAPYMPDPGAEVGMLATAVIPVLLTSLVFTHRWVLGTAAATILMAAILLLASPQPFKWKNTAFALLIIVGVIDGLILVFRYHLGALERRHIEQIRQSQAEFNKIQEQLQQAVKMETVGKLAGGMAHDFNNLLTAILANADLALLEHPGENQTASALREVVKAANSGASLIRQLLTFSRRGLINPRLVDLNGLLAEIQNMLGRLIGEDVRLEIKPSGIPCLARIDASLIEQVIVNLAVNAKDAMPDGGKLVIEIESQKLETDSLADSPSVEPRDYAVIAVSDSGIGMPPEVQARLFEPFFTTKPPGRGTGLGLASAYGAVKQSGGHITVQSEPGRGTTFRIFLPLAEGRAEPADAPAQKPTGGKETVLMAEDDQEVRTLAERLLRHLGYTVLVAADGRQALRLAESPPGSIDLLMTDMVMPGMNGRELAERFSRMHPESRILFTSGYADDLVPQAGQPEALIDFLAKPYTLDSLGSRIRKILDRPAG